MLLFADVKRSDWAYSDIRKLTDAAIISGDKSSSQTEAKYTVSHTVNIPRPLFRPDDSMSREECAVVISRLDELIIGAETLSGSIRASNEQTIATPSRSFSDVSPARWSYPYIETAKKYITSHSTRGDLVLFRPGEPISRGDFISALMRLIGVDAKFTDSAVLDAFYDGADLEESWKPYIAVAAAKSVLLGDDENMLRLNEPVSRREVCALIVRALREHIVFPDPIIPMIFSPDLDSGFYDAYFQESVFVGDSITMGLRNYVLAERSRGKQLLGNAGFLCVGSYGLRAAAGDFDPDGVNLSYQGVSMLLEDCLAAMGADEVYLMLGMNDWAGASLPDSIDKYGVILDKIYAKNPGATVYIQFCTPITLSREAAKLNNANTDKFNDAIVGLCEERGIDYVDVNKPMKDENNALKREFASDSYVHLNASGCEAWIGALREFAKAKYVSGRWSGPVGAAPAETYPGSYVETD